MKNLKLREFKWTFKDIQLKGIQQMLETEIKQK